MFGNMRPGNMDLLREEAPRIPDYLELREQLARGIVRAIGAQDVAWHDRELRRIFAHKYQAPPPTGEALRDAARMLSAHRNLLNGTRRS
jgi:hypothetical protein